MSAHPISLSAPTRKQMAAELNALLTDLIDLRTQAKQAHWSARGPHFHQLHLLFDSLAAQADEHADSVAERVMALGGAVSGTAQAVAARSRLADFPGTLADGLGQAGVLAGRFADCANRARNAIRAAAEAADDVTADVFTQVCRELDKAVWLLAAHRPVDG